MILDAMRNWNIDARYEVDGSFFIHSNDVNPIIDGNKSIVIGRKGTGKTAISKFILNSKSAEVVDLNRFRFQSFFAFKNEQYLENSKYLDVWLYIIYISCLKVIENVDPAALTRGVTDIHILSLIRSKGQDTKPILSRILDTLGLSVNSSNFLNSSISLSVKDSSFTASDIRNRNVKLESYISEFISKHNDKIFILIDDLDQDLGNRRSEKKEYQALISSLLYAITYLKDNILKIRVVVFMREDIFFDLPETTKWVDLRIRLQWSKQKLRELTINKIRQSCNDFEADEKELLGRIFSNEIVQTGSGKKVSVLDHLINYSQYRPRDVIGYLKLCAESVPVKSKEHLTQADFMQSLRDQAYFIAQGVKEELEWYYGNVEDIYESIVECGHPRFRYSDLSANLKRICQTDEKKAYEIVCHLYRYGIVGNQYNQSDLFVFTDPQIRFNIDRAVIVHRAVQKRFGM